MPQLPTPFRAALGLVATALDNAKDLPEKAIELPMLAVSTALQLSLRAQQRYAALAVRGEELLAGNRTTDEPPPWAQFDDPVDDVLAAETTPPAKKAPAKETPAKKPTAAKKAAEKKAPAKKAPTKGTTATPATVVPTQEKSTGKSVRTPRNSAPSRFDAVGDDIPDDTPDDTTGE